MALVFAKFNYNGSNRCLEKSMERQQESDYTNIIYNNCLL
jgi:hypothetical protein